ncbi:MAG: toprim domain-containing protein [Chloroflexi bacterium]|nr:toprim domain-containing protein [Chloroflexota bacterium]
MRVSIDTAAIKARIDLLELIGVDTRLKRAALTRGGEYAGACPFCGGRDRLRVQPERRRWWCRGCCDGPRWQDAISYLQRRDGVDFVEACRRLGASESELGRRQDSGPRASAQQHTEVLDLVEDLEPTSTWRKNGLALVEEAEVALWSPAGARARTYLHARGLEDHTLHAWRIGFQPRANRREPAERWGLVAHSPAGQPAWVRIPRGIVIPWLLDDRLWQLKVRTNHQEPKYLAIRGGHPCLYGADTLVIGESAVLAEGEFDTMLLWQTAGDLVGTATLGSCSRRLSPGALRSLLGCSQVLVVYDADKEGDKGAEYVCQLLPRAHRARPPRGKDVSTYHELEGQVREWLQRELMRAETR